MRKASRLPAFSACRRVAGLLLAAWMALAGAAWAQQGLQPVPELTAHVMDGTGTLSEARRKALEARLTAFEQQRGVRLVLLLVPTTQPEDIVSYTRRVGDAWQIGPNDEGDGLLLVVAGQERMPRIVSTPALESLIPEPAADRIIARDITPRLGQGDFAGGLEPAPTS